MRVPLILTPVCTLVHPFAIVLGQSIEIDPYRTTLRRDDALGTIEVDRHLIAAIFYIDE